MRIELFFFLSLKVSYVRCGIEMTCIKKGVVGRLRRREKSVSTLLYPVRPGGCCARSWLAVAPGLAWLSSE